jgi:uracil phosphoribosyltransferase
MTLDIQYRNLSYNLSQIDHRYGANVHILKDPYLITLLEKICSDKTQQPLFTLYVKKAYGALMQKVIAHSLNRIIVKSATRMASAHVEGLYQGEIIDPDNKVVCVDLARAGMIPTQVLYEDLNFILHPENVRQDHFYAARKVNEKGEVIGVDISGSKIGGDIDGAYVILPDPMGATGTTICHAIDHYKNHVDGKAKKFITVHLIITPEYIQKLKATHPDVEIYAIRLDRGLSTLNALSSIPGSLINEEKGLNDHQYIVPGAGGVGELLNNSYV